jgi:hypothetical protein
MPEEDNSIIEPATYTIEKLKTCCQDVTEKDVMIFVSRYSQQTLVDMGDDVRTSRITTDGTRLYGISMDFITKATADQKKAVRGLSLAMVKAAIWSMIHGDDLYNARRKAKSKKQNTQTELAAAAEEQRENVLAERKVLISTLNVLAAGDPVWVTRIINAQGSIATPESLSQSIEDLSDVTKKMLDDTTPDMVGRRRILEISDDWTTDLDDLGKAVETYVETATEAGSATTTALVSQAEVDYWDGINLVLFCLILDIHESGHRKDPSVPRLVPISLYKWYTSSARKPKPSDETTPPT